jgi:hypothetical protein
MALGGGSATPKEQNGVDRATLKALGDGWTTPVWPKGGFGHPHKPKKEKKRKNQIRVWPLEVVSATPICRNGSGTAKAFGVISTTPILLFESGQTTPKCHGGGSTTPRPIMAVARPPLFLSIFFFFFFFVFVFVFFKGLFFFFFFFFFFFVFFFFFLSF